MLKKFLLSARLLLVVPVFGLLAASVALFAKGLRLVLEQLDNAVLAPAEGHDLPSFEVSVLEGINLLLVGAGCLVLALGMFSLFIKPLPLPSAMRAESFHSLKGQFANFVIIAMAVSFLESLRSSLKNPPTSAKMGQLPSPDARPPGAQRLPVLLRVD